MEEQKLEAKHLFPDVQGGGHECGKCMHQNACSVLIMLGMAEAVRLNELEVAIEGSNTLKLVLESWIERRKTTPDVEVPKANADVVKMSDKEFETIPEGRFFKA